MTRRAARRENSAGCRGVLARVSERDHAQAELVKNREQMEIISQRLRTFHCEKKRNFFLGAGAFDLGKISAKLQLRRLRDLPPKERDLVKRDTQAFRQILVFDVKRRA